MHEVVRGGASEMSERGEGEARATRQIGPRRRERAASGGLGDGQGCVCVDGAARRRRPAEARQARRLRPATPCRAATRPHLRRAGRAAAATEPPRAGRSRAQRGAGLAGPQPAAACAAAARPPRARFEGSAKSHHGATAAQEQHQRPPPRMSRQGTQGTSPRTGALRASATCDAASLQLSATELSLSRCCRAAARCISSSLCKAPSAGWEFIKIRFSFRFPYSRRRRCRRSSIKACRAWHTHNGHCRAAPQSHQ